jgi:hypothetical protein
MGEKLNESVAEGVERASAPGREMIKKHFASMFAVEPGDIKTMSPMVQQMMGVIGTTLNEELGNEELEKQLNRYLNEVLSSTFGESDYKFIKQAIDLGAINYIDFFDDETLNYILSQFNNDEYKQMIREAWESMLKKSIGEESDPVTVEAKAKVDSTVEEATKDKPEVPSVEENPAVQQAKETKEEIKEIADEAENAKTTILKLDDVTLNTKNLESGADTAASAIADMARRIRDAFATLDGLSYEMDVNGAKYSGAMHVLIPNIEQRASGGFVKSGDLVMANENGDFEMMGRMGNQPVVANNQQIVSGISQGVAQANNGVESRLTTIEGLLTRILQKEFVAKAVPGSDWGNHNVRSNDAYSKVTG